MTVRRPYRGHSLLLTTLPGVGFRERFPAGGHPGRRRGSPGGRRGRRRTRFFATFHGYFSLGGRIPFRWRITVCFSDGTATIAHAPGRAVFAPRASQWEELVVPAGPPLPVDLFDHPFLRPTKGRGVDIPAPSSTTGSRRRMGFHRPARRGVLRGEVPFHGPGLFRAEGRRRTGESLQRPQWYPNAAALRAVPSPAVLKRGAGTPFARSGSVFPSSRIAFPTPAFTLHRKSFKGPACRNHGRTELLPGYGSHRSWSKVQRRIRKQAFSSSMDVQVCQSFCRGSRRRGVVPEYGRSEGSALADRTEGPVVQDEDSPGCHAGAEFRAPPTEFIRKPPSAEQSTGCGFTARGSARGAGACPWCEADVRRFGLVHFYRTGRSASVLTHVNSTRATARRRPARPPRTEDGTKSAGPRVGGERSSFLPFHRGRPSRPEYAFPQLFQTAARMLRLECTPAWDDLVRFRLVDVAPWMTAASLASSRACRWCDHEPGCHGEEDVRLQKAIYCGVPCMPAILPRERTGPREGPPCP